MTDRSERVAAMQISRPYRRGDSGPAVAEIRTKLATLGLLPAPDGGVEDPQTALFDDACDRAVRQFQQQRGISVDGLVGPETYRVLEEARWRLGDRLLAYSVARPLRGDDVVLLQRRLRALGADAGRVDGIFGPDTERGLREFQQEAGIAPDGTCGPATFKALDHAADAGVAVDVSRLRPPAYAGSGPTLAGKTVVLDPGHGGADRGAGGFGLDEASLVEDLASRVEGRLTATGMTAFLTRGPDGELNDAARADFANATNADLLLSLHIDALDVDGPDSDASGVAAFYFGREGLPQASPDGERFATLVQREIVARTDLADLGVWGKTWEILRRTRMPAVRVEIGYLSSADDARRLASPEFRDTVAEAIVVAVRRLYLPPESDPPTGQMSLPALSG
ncbi:MAG: N-acetylmuramoyl-L-alanine amidase [Actinomycetes bacterium]